MIEQPYDAEAVCRSCSPITQRCLGGIKMARGNRWLLVQREIGVGGNPDAGSRWSVDHLFLDEDGIPTLIEAKRSTDTRIRREVVGQMLAQMDVATAQQEPDATPVSRGLEKR